MIRNLPEGITYLNSDSSDGEEPKQIKNASGQGNSSDDELKEGDIVRIGKFKINIAKVTKIQLISIRDFLPVTEYRLLKNRMTARQCRRKRKAEKFDMQQ